MNSKLKMIEESVLSVHESTDMEMKGVKKTCGRFCSNCCYQSVGINGVEGLLIERFIEEEMTQKIRKSVKQNVQRWMLTFNRITPHADTTHPLSTNDFFVAEGKLTKKKIACPFLINNQCSIYPIRPTVCRTYVSNDDPELCKVVPPKATLPEAIAIHETAQGKISEIHTLVQIRPLVYAVLDVLKITVERKPIAMHAGINESAKY